MAEKPLTHSTPAVLRSAGRKALAVLRHTRQRAKLGTLHLPLDLHPSRQDGILLPPAAAEPLPAPASNDGAAPSRATEDSRRPRPSEETRALRSRLGMAERRIVRLRQALERERARVHRRGRRLPGPTC